MAETVYVLGAGANRCLSDWDGLRPPLTGDFFQQALQHRRFAQDWYLKRLAPLFAFIERYWHRDRQSLLDQAFDLEECYTLLQLQRQDAEHRGDRDTLVELIGIETLITSWFAEFLDGFFDPKAHERPFAALAESILRDKSGVLTFNYDTLLEQALESASGVNPHVPGSLLTRGDPSDDDLTYSHSNWNRPRAYGVEFDDVHLHRAGLPVFVPGDRFYRHPGNALYKPPILKLHGSTNWFVHSGIMMHPSVPEAQARRGRTLVYGAHASVSFPAQRDLELLIPLVITPVLYKPLLDLPPLPTIWALAGDQIRSCERLILIGYSFPPTDFHVRRLFREAFVDRSPREVVVVNPDTRAIQITKDLCNFQRPVQVCRDLDEFVGARSA